jgi:hypothetical protein
MADQPRADVAVAGESQLASTAATPSPHAGHHGRPVSWASVIIITIGFIAGGIGLIAGPTWWLFWVGIGLFGFGGILALSTGIFNDWY